MALFNSILNLGKNLVKVFLNYRKNSVNEN